MFWSSLPDSLANLPLVNSQAASAPDTTPLEPGSTLKLKALQIALINAAAFVHACKLEGSMTFRLDLASLELSSHTTSVPETYDPVDLLDIPKDYYNFADVFSKAKANNSAPHWPYDLKITLEDGKEPPQPPIYLLSTSGLKTLWEFLNEHLNIGFIRPSWSSHGALILSIKKRMARFGFVLISTGWIKSPRLLPTPTHLGFVGPALEGSDLFKDWLPPHIPSHPNHQRRWVENHVQNSLQLIWVVGHALSKIRSLPKPYICGILDHAKDLPISHKTSRAQP